ncbi:MAG: hypothetical protein N2234_05710 [Planctomycetota bacterium]|nr:hypothetical protein [Planctomycetota bacterium]
MRRRARINEGLVAIIFLALLFSAGCTTPKIQPLAALEGRSVAVVPFSFKEHRLGESRAGKDMSRLVVAILRERVKDVKLVSEKPAEKLFYGKRIEDVKWETVTFVTGCEMLLTAHIAEFRIYSPRYVNLYEGVAEVVVFLFDKDGKQVLSQRVIATYPFREISAPISRFDMSEQEFSSALMGRAAVLIARLFHEYSPEEE